MMWKECQILGRRSIKLTSYDPNSDKEDVNKIPSDKMFFFETSGKSWLNPRQLCAVESAARNSLLSRVIVLINNDTLTLNRDENDVLCAVFNGKFPSKIRFHKVDITEDISDTPLTPLFVLSSLKLSQYPSTHLSDILRIAFLYKFGGFYADLDYVFVKPVERALKKGRNAVFVTGYEKEKSLRATNSIMVFSQTRHPLLEGYMKLMDKKFTGKNRIEIGPKLFTQAIRNLCNASNEFDLLFLAGNHTYILEYRRHRLICPPRPSQFWAH